MTFEEKDIKREVIHEASELLKQVYEDYKDRGILAVYLWGSIARDDWDPGLSDVDAMAIVDHSMDLDERVAIKQRHSLFVGASASKILSCAAWFSGEDGIVSDEPAPPIEWLPAILD